MIQAYLLQARYAARFAARRAIWSSVGGIFVLIGMAFFSIAVWIIIEATYGARNAALIFGAIFVAIGFFCLAFSRVRPRIAPPTMAPPPAGPAGPAGSVGLSLANMIGAIVMGIAAGRAVRR